MIPISDSGPIISLARAGHLNLLEAVLSQVIIPTAVFQEVVSDPSRPGASAVQSGLEWLSVRSLQDSASLHRVLRTLDDGEREVLALALELGGWPVVIDERAGRREAQRLGLPVISTLGVVRQARQRGHIPAARPVTERLVATGFRIQAQLLADYLRDLGE